MQTSISYTDHYKLTPVLNATFGAGVFAVVIDRSRDYKSLLLEYADNTPQEQVDQALAIAAQQANEFFLQNQRDYYDRIIRASGKTIDRYRPAPPTSEQATEAANWLAAPTSTCPEWIADQAFLTGTTTQQVAQNAVDQNSIYQNFLIEVANVRTSGKTAILAATDYVSVKVALNSAMDQLTALEEQHKE